MCSQCPALIGQVGSLTQATENLVKSIQILDELNRQDHKVFYEAISDLKGWRKWLIGVSVGVSTTVSVFMVILGFILHSGAWPLSLYPQAEASETYNKPPAKKIYEEVAPHPPQEVEEDDELPLNFKE